MTSISLKPYIPVETTITEEISLEKRKGSEKFDLSLKGIVNLCKEDNLYATHTLLSLSLVAYGIINGCVTGDFAQVKFGTGLFGMCNLIKGQLTNDNEVSKLCIKLGTISSIASFLFPLHQSDVFFLLKDDYYYRCHIKTSSVYDLCKKSLGFSTGGLVFKVNQGVNILDYM